jgi:hypothetical protein
MATTLAVVVLIALAAGTVLGLLRLIQLSRRRVRELEAELDDVYEVQHILQRARDRKHGRHLHLLVAVPAAWLVARLGSRGARLAAATAASTMVAGASVMSVDGHHVPKPLAPPAGAEAIEPVSSDGTVPSYAYTPPPSTTSTSVSAAVDPPSPAADVERESAPFHAPTASTPSTTTTSLLPELPTTTTTLELPVELPPLPCLNPQGLPLPPEVCD